MTHTTIYHEGKSNLYLHIDDITSYEEVLYIFKTTKRVAGKLSKKMLSYLHIHCKNQDRKYLTRKTIFLKTIEIYLPPNYNLNYLSGHISRFVCESLEGLPYYAYLTFKNDCTCLNIIVCERKYTGKKYAKRKEQIYIGNQKSREVGSFVRKLMQGHNCLKGLEI